MMMDEIRQIVNKFLMLPHCVKLTIACKLGLSKEKDDELNDIKHYKAIFRRAKESGRLDLLKEEIEAEAERRERWMKNC
jgi:hypothetical protein